MPIEFKIEELKEHILDQNAMIRIINEVENVEIRAKLMYLYNVIIALWMYWNLTHEEDVEFHIQYYQTKFFNLLFKSKGE